MTKRGFRPSLSDPDTLGLLVRNLGSGVYITHTNGRSLTRIRRCWRFWASTPWRSWTTIGPRITVDPDQRDKELSRLHDGDLVTEYEFQVRRPSDGEIRTLLDTCHAVRDSDSGELHFMGILVDITYRKELETRLEQLSIRDRLTGCYNRRHMAQVGDELADRAGTWGSGGYRSRPLQDLQRSSGAPGRRPSAGQGESAPHASCPRRGFGGSVGGGRVPDRAPRGRREDYGSRRQEARQPRGPARRGSLQPGVGGPGNWDECLEATVHRADRHLLERRSQARAKRPAANEAPGRREGPSASLESVADSGDRSSRRSFWEAVRSSRAGSA